MSHLDLNNIPDYLVDRKEPLIFWTRKKSDVSIRFGAHLLQDKHEEYALLAIDPLAEIYISADLQNIVEVCSQINYSEGHQHQWVEYRYPTIEYLKNPQSGGTETCQKIETILLDRLRSKKNQEEDVYRISRGGNLF